MNDTRFRLCVLVIGVLCLLPQSTHAQTLTITQPFKHEGLTFSSPLSFDHPTQLIKPVTLEFGILDKIAIQPENTNSDNMEIIVTPTPTVTSLPRFIQTAIADEKSTPTLSPDPTRTPTPLPTAIPTPSPQATIVTSPSNPGGLNADILFQMVNTYRANKGLPAFQKDEKTCSLASSRAPEISEEIANNRMHSGLRDRNLPYWNTENIISMRNETEAFNWWINDQIHKDAIESNNTFSCTACFGNSCAQEFTNYQPK